MLYNAPPSFCYAHFRLAFSPLSPAILDPNNKLRIALSLNRS